MGFVLIFVITWLALFIFYSMDRSLSIVENSFIYLIVFTIGIHIYWVIAEELKLVSLTKEGLPYTALILYRSIVIPMIFVIMFNVIYKVKSTLIKILSMAGTLGIILALNGLLRLYKIWDYKQWNIYYDIVITVLLLAISFGLLKLYRKAIHYEVNVS